MIETLKSIYGILTGAERREAVSLLALTAIGMLLEALGIGLIIPTLALLIQPNLAAYNAYLEPFVRPLLTLRPTEVATAAMVVLMATYGVKNAFLGYFVWRQNRMTNRVRASISRRLLTIYLRQPWTFYLEKNSAELMRNVTGEAATFSGTLTHAIIFVTESMVLIGIAGLLVLVEPVGTLVTVALLGLSALAFYVVARKQTLRWGSARQVHDALLLQHLQQALGGVKDVKLLGREKDLLGQYDVHNVASARALEFQSTMTHCRGCGSSRWRWLASPC
jgi:ATP-binding cassette, subfamily B, bacterial PglK